MTENIETEQPKNPASLGVQTQRFVMCEGFLPDFDGKPVLASCRHCTWCMDESDGPEYGPEWYACEKPGKEHMSNLKWFPFKTAQKCCELSIGFTIDWTAYAKKRGYT
jgi:hypothetical protein